jgi:hypothetical protein
MAVTVLGKGGAFWDDIEAGKEGQALVHDIAHDVAVPAAAEQLQSLQGKYGTVGRDLLGAREMGFLDDSFQSDLGQVMPYLTKIFSTKMILRPNKATRTCALCVRTRSSHGNRG